MYSDGSERVRIKKLKRKLDSLNSLFILIHIQRKRIINLVIILKSRIGNTKHQIIRYDCSHGQFHKHLFFESKKTKEFIYSDLNPKLIDEIIKEIEENYLEWRKKFIENLGRLE